MGGYADFALFYDGLMEDVDYSARAEYIMKLFERFGKKPTLLLDLACGTGGFSREFAKMGVEVIGADISEDMLSVARENAEEEGLDILFLCQDAAELDLFGTIDGAVCCMDSLNHITDIEKLNKAISRVSLFMEKDSLFIFDVNTVFKHRQILGNNTFVIEDDEVFCVWQNEFFEEDLKTRINLDFFLENGGVYERYSESFCERAYTDEEIREILNRNGFSVEAVFGDMQMESPNPLEERIFYIAKKLA